MHEISKYFLSTENQEQCLYFPDSTSIGRRRFTESTGLQCKQGRQRRDAALGARAMMVPPMLLLLQLRRIEANGGLPLGQLSNQLGLRCDLDVQACAPSAGAQFTVLTAPSCKNLSYSLLLPPFYSCRSGAPHALTGCLGIGAARLRRLFRLPARAHRLV